MAYFDLDISPIIARCQERGDIKHVRFPVRDFDPFSLRQRLPDAVAILVKEAATGRGKLYVHCTAGEQALSYMCVSMSHNIVTRSFCQVLMQQQIIVPQGYDTFGAPVITTRSGSTTPESETEPFFLVVEQPSSQDRE